MVRAGQRQTTSERGAWAEDHARGFLEARGLCCVDSNFHAAGGEIDLIMREGRTIAFVEVRLRATNRFGGAAHSVTRTKQRRLVRAAEAWLQSHPAERHSPCRFDVVAMSGQAPVPVVDWLRGAFDAV